LKRQQNINHESLPSSQSAVIGALYKQIHMHPEQASYSNLELTTEVNLILAAFGERHRMTWKAVGNVLKTHEFLKKRTKHGWVVLLNRAARKRVHELMSRYAVDVPAICFLSQELEEACEFCRAQPPEHSEAPESNESAGNRPDTKAVDNSLEKDRNREKEEEIEDIKYRTEEDIENTIPVEDIRIEDIRIGEGDNGIEDDEVFEDDEEEDVDKYDPH
jgi:hypothetical protein